MGRFPVLYVYKYLLYVIAAILIIIGALVAYEAAKSPWLGFRWRSFFATFVPFFGVAFLLTVSAEVIQLCLAIEDHLFKMRQMFSWTVAQQKQIQSGTHSGRPGSQTTSAQHQDR